MLYVNKNTKINVFLIIFYVCALFAINVKANECDELDSDAAAAKFKTATLQSCDEVFNKLIGQCSAIGQGILANAWAECWKRSMNFELNKRLLKLKNTDTVEFHLEMDLQKAFNQATHNLCGKDCHSEGSFYRYGVPNSYCRVDAYKYCRIVIELSFCLTLVENIQSRVSVDRKYLFLIQLTLLFGCRRLARPT